MIGLLSAPERPLAPGVTPAGFRAALAELKTERAARVEQMRERWPYLFPPADSDAATVSLPDELWVHIFRLLSTDNCILGGRTLMLTIPTVCRR